MQNDGVLRCPCNSCARETRHLIVATRTFDASSDLEAYGHYSWTDRYDMLQCCGCGAICMRMISDDAPDSTGTTFYPPRALRRLPNWLVHVPNELRGILSEVYAALQSDLRRLALMGTRTLLDILLVQQVGKDGSFAQKLDRLVKKGELLLAHKELLQVVLDAGHAATHRAYQATPEQMKAVMDIIENLLQAKYHLDKLATQLRSGTPIRER